MKMPQLISYQGQTRCLADWAAQTGLPRYVLAKRLKAGWSVEDTLTVPVLEQYRRAKAVSQETAA
jgi:hypothetical protein